MAYQFSEKEIGEIKNQFPEMDFKIHKGIHFYEGIIRFDRIFKDYRIIDAFKLRIIFPDEYPKSIPVVKEIGDRINKIKAKFNITDLRDIHYNPGNFTACLCVKPMERIKFPDGSNFVDFLNDLVIPYLYGLSYFEENGVWPWKECSHGGLGLLEYYFQNRKSVSKDSIIDTIRFLRKDGKWKDYGKYLNKKKPRRLCLCDSGKIFSECHSDAWEGLKLLQDDVRFLSINIYNC